MTEFPFEKFYHHPHKKRIKNKTPLIIIGIFIILLIAILYPLIFSGFNSSKNSNPDNSGIITFNSQLDIPEMKLKERFDKVVFSGKSLSILEVGSQEVSLSQDVDSEISLINYKGKLYFNESSIYVLDGKAEKVLLNGIPIASKSRSTLNIEFNEPFEYTVLEIPNFKKSQLKYSTSGYVNLNNEKTIVNLEDEQILMKDILASLKISQNKMNLVGNLSYFETTGKQNIVIG